ncbi:hypothetical protein [Microlunatus sp. Gsoil 973]|uniref:hypothetical protein n=1 Tax=Microlunatus sp. Gsoil 973 TaxID=2672569 RepID=UPI0012B4EEDC|nr:hypothetical protein [Microlunatus sp. Gsoil 973]QGN34101.1 hypothetical protein GJV80_16170 [Microlunatus sp. Gsoil 973]
MAAAIVVFSVTAFAAVGAMTWLGVRDGDRLGDLGIDVRVESSEQPGAAVALVTLSNPGERPVVTAVRTGRSSRPVWLAGQPTTRKTILRPVQPPEDAIVDVVPEQSTRHLSLPVDLAATRPVRIDVLAYQQPGRVRLVSHRVDPVYLLASQRRSPTGPKLWGTAHSG